MLKKLTNSILLFIIPLVILGQVVDSLKVELYNNQDLREKRRLSYNIANAYLRYDIDSAEYYNNQAYEYSVQLLDNKAIIPPVFVKVAIASRKKDYPRVDSLYDVLWDLIESVDDSLNLKSMYFGSLGTYYQRRKMLDSAINVYQRALEMADSTQSDYYRTNHVILSNLGLLERRRGNLGKALNHFHSAQEMMELDTFSFKDRYKVLNSLGLVYKSMGNYKTSLVYFHKAIRQVVNLPEQRAGIFQNMGEAYGHLNDTLRMEQIQDSLIYMLNSLNEEHQCRTYYFLTSSYLAADEVQKAKNLLSKVRGCHAKDLTKDWSYNNLMGLYYSKIGQDKLALEHYKTAKTPAYLIDNVQLKQHTQNYHDIVRLSIATKEPLDSIQHYFDKYVTLNDSLRKIVVDQEIEQWSAKYQTEKKEAENVLLKNSTALQSATINNQRLFIAGTGGSLLLLAMFSTFLYRRNQERKKTNALLSKQKDEIELLHKELAHRVKNNLLFMSSLLSLQGRSLEDGKAKEAIKEGEARLQAVSLVHRKLGINDKYRQIHLEEYIDEICSNLTQAYPMTPMPLDLRTQSVDILINAEDAMRIGIIVNELVTNSLKHAFTDQTKPLIRVIINRTEDQHLSLRYLDNGKGLTIQQLAKNTESLGMKLINLLTKQLNGQLIVNEGKGTSLQFIFKIPHESGFPEKH